MKEAQLDLKEPIHYLLVGNQEGQQKMRGMYMV